jgi:hypothetical protein
MKKIIFVLTLLITIVFANEAELLFWDEVKDSSDVELLKLYKKQYPHGTFESLADIKIKRLMKSNIVEEENPNLIPSWIKGYSVDYEYYGVGKANTHFKGKHYQENLAKSRAKKELQNKLDNTDLSQKKMYEYLQLVQTKKYVDEKGRIYILLYIDNYDL